MTKPKETSEIHCHDPPFGFLTSHWLMDTDIVRQAKGISEGCRGPMALARLQGKHEIIILLLPGQRRPSSVLSAFLFEIQKAGLRAPTQWGYA